MTVAETIEQKVADAIAPVHLEVINESHMHNVPPGSESHFKLIIVSDAFDGKRLVGRHQIINGVLKDELDGPVHALSMETHTPSEWEARGGRILASPSCRGGSKHDPAFGG
ncbi:MAG: BolA/IbaG family iron-sulfur metabolism protein [Rhodospirillales bacterium]|nr:BolA/IbaG family iron-sulfur metabolism protein [Rhodospirillales bacterium]MBO6786955.1 BolA/IbaG family iron-sulfur metabolism protein [Rhodospirillales bacterium]